MDTDLPEMAGGLQRDHCDIELFLSWPWCWEEGGNRNKTGAIFPIVLSQAHFSLSLGNPDMLRDQELNHSHLYIRDELRFLVQCLLISRASVQRSSSTHMCCFNFSCESHLPLHSYHHAGLNISAFMSPWEDLIQWLWGVEGDDIVKHPHYLFPPSLYSSPPFSWIDSWRIQIPFLYPIEASIQSQHSHLGPTPGELIKPFLLIIPVAPLREILESKISPSHSQNEVFPRRCLGGSHMWSPGGHLLGLQDAWSCLSLQLILIWPSQPLGLHSKTGGFVRIFWEGKEALKTFSWKKTKTINNCVLMNSYSKKKQNLKSSYTGSQTLLPPQPDLVFVLFRFCFNSGVRKQCTDGLWQKTMKPKFQSTPGH